uniref:Sad1 and UNC84 domain containing 2 n=1 Tax=Molossus molossus TaxID=27622 RepID=A0A7J8G1I8_MOLMO|nr:Sad1 and UNC84 domain containing 2 [Molossus molossus]
MSRRSQRLTRYSQGDDDGGSSSGGSSVAGSQSTLFRDSPFRTLKRKSSNTKRLSPAPQLGPSSDTHTSYYSESVVRESYFGSPRAASLARSSILDDQLHSDPYWSKCPEPFSWGFASSGNLRSQMLAPPHPRFPNPAGPEEGSLCSETLGRAARCLSCQAPSDDESPCSCSKPRRQGGWAQLTSAPPIPPGNQRAGERPRADSLRVSPGDPPEYPPQHRGAPGEPHALPSSGEDLRVRRRRGTGGTESSKVNGLVEAKLSEDFLGSSSGYSSEDDYVGRLFGLLYWWVGTTWYRLTTAASLLDVFVLTRRFSSLKTFLWFLLLLLLLTGLTYGAWYFYPYGLQTLHPAVVSWWAARGSGQQHEVWESRDSSPHLQAEQRMLSRVHSLERRLEALAAEFSSNWQKEAMRLERLELRQGAAGAGGGGGLSQEDTLALLEGLVSRREAALKEDFRRDTAARIQEELITLRAEHQQDSEDLFKKIVQASQESEARLQQLKSEWHRMTQESFRENSMKELGRLEGQLAGLRQELAALAQKQSSVADQVGLLPQQLQAMRDNVESQFPAWVSQFLLQSRGTRTGLLQREEMQAQLQELESKILAHVAEMQGRSAREAVASLGLRLQKEGVIGVTEEEVHRIVSQALKRYSEDRIGMVDYALESGGASVISTRCSETYETKTALLSLFGIPLWYHSQSPRVILQPDVHPGNCWAFQGPQGFAVIRLSARIHPTAVTLEHVPKSLSPNSTISSAPKDFAVFGFDEDLQQEGTLLGQFTYNQDGEPIQTFYFQDPKMATYQVVELRILTNWGHPEYTCIYRFRVHGEPAH